MKSISSNSHLLEMVCEAVQHIESHLTESISIKDVTERFEKSHWQFQRIFSSVLGVSMGHYLRERRLTEASHMLRETRQRILDIALSFDFGSEEAFIRSFKSLFGITPNQFRKNREFVLREVRNSVDKEKLDYFWQNIQRMPSISELSEKTLLGMSVEFKSHFILGSECHKKIVPHWNEFKKRMDLIPNRIGQERIGVVLTSELELREERLTYFSGVEVGGVNDILEDMHEVVLPSGLYACFENNTANDKNGHLIDYIYGVWFPTSLYKRRSGYDFEIFDHRYIPGNPNSLSRFYVPIEV